MPAGKPVPLSLAGWTSGEARRPWPETHGSLRSKSSHRLHLGQNQCSDWGHEALPHPPDSYGAAVVLLQTRPGDPVEPKAALGLTGIS